jgi:hypothetical protein
LEVWNNEKAAWLAFKHIAANISEDGSFPGISLYKLFVGITGDSRCAHCLISPEEFDRRLCRPASSAWRTDAERFVEDGVRNEIGLDWWWKGRKLLPWLQRAYIMRVFPDYMPLTDHEDDTPYDEDHICPFKDWGENWRILQHRLDANDDLTNKMHSGRQLHWRWHW